MSIYAIGDVQGCYQALMALLTHIHFDAKKDFLWFTGDLVNRGPQSLEVVRFVKNLGNRAVSVLGNHDLHYLAVAAGIEVQQEEDTFQDLLNAPDAKTLFEWMRHLPLVHSDNAFLLVHAGIAPEWDLATTLDCTREVENILRGPHYLAFLEKMYGDSPIHWNSHLNAEERFRLIINYCTRMRYVDYKGNLALSYKGRVGTQPKGYHPWFTFPSCLSPDIHIIFGHWAALEGKTGRPYRHAVDSGCCWGNALTALRLEDLTYFSIKCHNFGVK